MVLPLLLLLLLRAQHLGLTPTPLAAAHLQGNNPCECCGATVEVPLATPLYSLPHPHRSRSAEAVLVLMAGEGKGGGQAGSSKGGGGYGRGVDTDAQRGRPTALLPKGGRGQTQGFRSRAAGGTGGGVMLRPQGNGGCVCGCRCCCSCGLGCVEHGFEVRRGLIAGGVGSVHTKQRAVLSDGHRCAVFGCVVGAAGGRHAFQPPRVLGRLQGEGAFSTFHIDMKSTSPESPGAFVWGRVYLPFPFESSPFESLGCHFGMRHEIKVFQNP
eukprot:1158760-Pelagomonas_calceolata.AAC.13